MAASTKPVPVGALACQQNSKLSKLKTIVLHCSEKRNSKNLHEISLQDTVLFPEGGGQPCDHGTVDDVAIVDVQRRGENVIHFATAPLPVGKEVLVQVDTERRLDHTQQHSGQHLLSAIAESPKFQLPTTSWALGEHRSYIEVPCAMLSTETLQSLEDRVNEYIRAALPVTVSITSERPDSLPEDYKGDRIRIVEIQGLDRNPCCGTHVSSTAELQVIKLILAERVKGGMTRIHFLVGNRVIRYLRNVLARERELNGILSTGPDTFVDVVSRLSKSAREAEKVKKSLLKEMAENFVSEDLARQLTENGYAWHHRDEADMDYLNALSRALVSRFSTASATATNATGDAAGEGGKTKGKKSQGQSAPVNLPGLILLTTGNVKTGGPVLLLGEAALVSLWAPGVVEAIGEECKGGGNGSKWQGKCSGFRNLEKARGVVRKIVEENRAK